MFLIFLCRNEFIEFKEVRSIWIFFFKGLQKLNVTSVLNAKPFFLLTIRFFHNRLRSRNLFQHMLSFAYSIQMSNCAHWIFIKEILKVSNRSRFHNFFEILILAFSK